MNNFELLYKKTNQIFYECKDNSIFYIEDVNDNSNVSEFSINDFILIISNIEKEFNKIATDKKEYEEKIIHLTEELASIKKTNYSSLKRKAIIEKNIALEKEINNLHNKLNANQRLLSNQQDQIM